MKLYITGGGTGGHVTPGLAIARYFEKKQPQTTVRFAGSARGIENKLVPREGYPLDTIEIIGMSRSMSPKGILHNLKAAKLAVSAVSKAKKLLKQAKPDCVIGCGGYASFAVVRAAQQLGIPTVLLEVNALPGKVTQMLAKDADRVLVCFEQAKELLGGGDKIILTGAPVRGEILAADRVKAREKFGLTDDDLKDQYQYTKDIVTVDGVQKGTTWQATPGLFAYRRSIAKDVLGTDDPTEVQAALSDWDKFNDVAEKAAAKGYKMLSGYDDSYRHVQLFLDVAAEEVGQGTRAAHRFGRALCPLRETVFLRERGGYSGHVKNSEIGTMGICRFLVSVLYAVVGAPFHIGLSAAQPNFA